MLDLNKYVARGKTAKDYAHTSSYAKAQAPDSFGATSSVDFATRRNVDLNRKVVRGYANSKILSQANPVRSSQAITPEKAFMPEPPKPMPVQLPPSPAS
ncbi:hypothetical protein FWF48_03615 [Candidatus Saccharibacteria bacterium]|nr:hypothetical protein [Candidatus Saccharibacteria bacterium]